MNLPAHTLTQREPSSWAELVAVTGLVWIGLLCIPLALGEIGLGWDALNHHIYLGWTAQAPRFDRDFLAASYQSYQYPYLYWPLYRLVQAQVPGPWAGAVLVSLHVTVVPALWLVARTCIADRGWYPAIMRAHGVVLALMSVLVLSILDSTQNDLLAAVPLVWAIALALPPPKDDAWTLSSGKRIALSGMCAGVAVAFKLSNGPLAILTPLLWAWGPYSLYRRTARVVVGSVCTLAGFLLAYWYWGWQLGIHYGNPLYPFYGHLFTPLAVWLGWQP